MRHTTLFAVLIAAAFAYRASAQPATGAGTTAPAPASSGSSSPTPVAQPNPATTAGSGSGSAGSDTGSSSGSASSNPNEELYDAVGKEIKDQLSAHKLPQTPATFALGLETTEVQRPATMQDVSAALLNSFNTDSTLKTGVAIEFAPFRIWKTSQFTAEKWAHENGSSGWGWGVLDSLSFSFATTEGDTDATGVKQPPISAAGMRVDLVNTADLRRSSKHYDCVKKELDTINDAAIGDNHQPQPDQAGPVLIKSQLSSEQKDALAKCEKEREGHVLEVAGAVLSTGEPAMKTSKFAGGRLWLAYEYAISSWDISAQVDYRDRKEDQARHDVFAGLRVDNTLGGQRRLALALEAYYAGTDLNVDADKKNKLGAGTAVDLKFDSGLVLSVGAQSRTDFSVFDLVVLTKISFMIDGESNEIASHYFGNH